jgi:thioredoxin reductase (NADPH)
VVGASSLAAGMSHYLVQQLEASPNITVRLETEVVVGAATAGWSGWICALAAMARWRRSGHMRSF